VRLYHSDYIEPQEVFLDSLARKKEEQLGLSEKKIEVPLSMSVMKIFFSFFILVMLFLLSKTFQMQIVQYTQYSALAQENRYVIKSLESGRGVIYDSKNVILASNRPSFNLIVNKDGFPKSEAEQDKILSEISSIVGEPLESLKEKIAKNKKGNQPTTLITE
ncbi:MAG: hypothetical protein NT148_01580, partial [Candidatus Nealsonbacteria bacterium]|nr:hypothetical protein [Candidatus Nealsonbacteria bacterium]